MLLKKKLQIELKEDCQFENTHFDANQDIMITSNELELIYEKIEVLNKNKRTKNIVVQQISNGLIKNMVTKGF